MRFEISRTSQRSEDCPHPRAELRTCVWKRPVPKVVGPGVDPEKVFPPKEIVWWEIVLPKPMELLELAAEISDSEGDVLIPLPGLVVKPNRRPGTFVSGDRPPDFRLVIHE